MALRSTGLRNTYVITQSQFSHYLHLFVCRIIICNQKIRRASAFEGLAKPLPANQAHLGRRAELAGTGLPGPTDVHNRKNFWGINYCSTHKKASKKPQFVDMFFRGYFRCLLELCALSVHGMFWNNSLLGTLNPAWFLWLWPRWPAMFLKS